MTSDRKYPEEYAEQARRVLRRFVAERGGQVEAAAALGMSQGNISRALSPSAQPSVKMLIALREHLRLSIDEILGLPPILNPGDVSTRELAERLSAVAELLRSQSSSVEVQGKVTADRGKGGRGGPK